MNLSTLAAASITHINANHIKLSIAGFTALYSYNSLIVVIEPSGQILLGVDWKFSKTTSKFLNESTATTKAKLASGEYKLLEDQTMTVEQATIHDYHKGNVSAGTCVDVLLTSIEQLHYHFTNDTPELPDESIIPLLEELH